jgi:hypothetical protein
MYILYAYLIENMTFRSSGFGSFILALWVQSKFKGYLPQGQSSMLNEFRLQSIYYVYTLCSVFFSVLPVYGSVPYSFRNDSV